ncbi:hypothetical protein HGP17_15070 [Rhizobium sp. P38BS-XIX]|uniref:hypothetical protein n=1 Tax=Rhizobium sp. P38BS-XIX TaxID=2726740 RepID=UPI0014569296|nr:hypothetical protein [Rhizobium sp. P38BS-XIX]NLR98134.1 hypothetical protein [Rhizobium sp. P38BS-XIX]
MAATCIICTRPIGQANKDGLQGVSCPAIVSGEPLSIEVTEAMIQITGPHLCDFLARSLFCVVERAITSSTLEDFHALTARIAQRHSIASPI